MDIKQILISKIEVWPKNIKVRATSTEAYNRTKKQIIELKPFKPATAYPENGKYFILGGRLRYFVMKDLKLKTMDLSIVHPKTDADKWKYVLADNDQGSEWLEDKLAEELLPLIGQINLEDYNLDIGKSISIKEVIENFAPDMPDTTKPKEPKLDSERFIEIYCSNQDLKEIEPKLREWSKKDGITINIS